MSIPTPAEWSYRFLTKFVVFKYSGATQDAGVMTKHLRHAHVRHFDGKADWEAEAPTPLAKSPASLSRSLIEALFDPRLLVDLAENAPDPIPGLEVLELPADAWLQAFNCE